MLQFLMSLNPFAKKDERGASAVEYGLLVAGIAALVVGAVFLLGDTVTGSFTDTQACIEGESRTSC